MAQNKGGAQGSDGMSSAVPQAEGGQNGFMSKLPKLSPQQAQAAQAALEASGKSGFGPGVIGTDPALRQVMGQMNGIMDSTRAKKEAAVRAILGA